MEGFQAGAVWPHTLTEDVCDSTVYDQDLFGERWRAQETRLFSSPSDVRIKVLGEGTKDLTFADEGDALTYMQNMPEAKDGLRVILIPQMSSWGSLMVSSRCMEALLTRLNAFPPVFDTLEAFGKRTGPSNESLGGIQNHRLQNRTEASLLLKHVDRHGREDNDDPWSIRQTGAYLQVNDDGHGTALIINPSRRFQQRLKYIRGQRATGATLKDVLSLLLSCASSQWGVYLNDLEAEYEQLKAKAYDASVRMHSANIRSMSIEFEDVQRMRVLGDKLSRIDHILDTNAEVCLHLAGSKMAKVNFAMPNFAKDSKMASMSTYFESEITLSRRRVASLLRRMAASSELMQNIIAAKGLNALQDGTQTTTGIMRLAQEDNQLMLKFSQKAQDDTRILKTITALTMIYLPASFVAQVLDMGYISVQRNASGISLHFRGELIIFLVLSCLFLLGTGAVWALMEWRRQRRPGQSSSRSDKVLSSTLPTSVGP